MYIKDLTEIERAEIRLKLQPWLLTQGFAIYKSSDDEIKKHKIKFEEGIPFKKDGKIIWFLDKIVALFSYHYDTYGFECEATIVNEPIDLNDYLLILELFRFIQRESSKSTGEDKIIYDKVIPTKIQSILLSLRYTVKEISNDKYFYGITEMELNDCIISFNNSLVSIRKKTEKSDLVSIGMFYISSLNIKCFFLAFLALGIISDTDYLIIQDKLI